MSETSYETYYDVIRKTRSLPNITIKVTTTDCQWMVLKSVD